MPQQPINASFGGGGWKRDSAGLMAPVGGSAGEKELLRLPKELETLATSANTLMRGRLAKELWPRLALLSTIAGPDHKRTKAFIANIVAGSMAENGLARTEYLEGVVKMLALSAMPYADRYYKDNNRNNNNKKQRVRTEEDE